ncbi:MAG TPA: Xaa-Pro aminopeptidase [Gemmatimonadaceae bacterium]|nr:Xaa-Pro aminopeptidase [Gemmatimonadaceae bacterium]
MRKALSLLLLAVVSSSGVAQITAQEYEQRRATLASRLPDGLFVIRGGESPVQDYLSFFQTNGFLYLTGYREPDAALILQKNGADAKWTLFVQTKDPAQEVWSGRRYGPDSASKATGLPTRPMGDGTASGKDKWLSATVDSLLRASPRLSYHADIAEGGDTLNNDDRFLDELRRKHTGLEVTSANPLVTTMRSKKSAAEMDLIQRAAAISMEAHAEAARALEPGMNEFEIQALLEYTFRRYGGDRPAYASIVGSGPNSTVLHYNRDDRYMKAGDLLLIDAAASFGGYAADITRTFPVSGKFTPEQREVYQIVRDAQAAAERAAKPGVAWRDVSRAASTVIAEGLARLGLIESPTAQYQCGTTDRPRQCSQASLYYMHGLGHGIGLAVHDPDQKDREGIAVGSAYSIEPGIYVRQELLDIIPKAGNEAMLSKIAPAVRKYANTGVRIEDNYVVTEEGVKWVSCVAREADEVEALMREPVKGAAVRDAEKTAWYGAMVVDAKAARPNASPAPKACNPKM